MQQVSLRRINRRLNLTPEQICYGRLQCRRDYRRPVSQTSTFFSLPLKTKSSLRFASIDATGRNFGDAGRRPGKGGGVHPTSSPAVAPPATDGQRVYVYFPPFGLIAYDLKGREQWRRKIPTGYVMNGSGTSPAIAGDTLLLNCDQDE